MVLTRYSTDEGSWFRGGRSRAFLYQNDFIQASDDLFYSILLQLRDWRCSLTGTSISRLSK